MLVSIICALLLLIGVWGGYWMLMLKCFFTLFIVVFLLDSAKRSNY